MYVGLMCVAVWVQPPVPYSPYRTFSDSPMKQTGARFLAVLCVWLRCVGTVAGDPSEGANPTCADTVIQRSARIHSMSAEEGEPVINSGFSSAAALLAETVEQIVKLGGGRALSLNRLMSSVWMGPSLALLQMARQLPSDDGAFNFTDFNFTDFDIPDADLGGMGMTLPVFQVLSNWVWIEVASCVVCLIAAFTYWSHGKKTRPESGAVAVPGDFEDWQHGLCPQCSSADCKMCGLALCCPSVRWANTVRRVGFLGFWVAFAIFLLLIQIVLYAPMCYFLLPLLGANLRQAMRKAYNMKVQGGVSWLSDFALYFCCSPCAIVQEAKQADEAFRVGLPVAVEPFWKETVPFPANNKECCPPSSS